MARQSISGVSGVLSGLISEKTGSESRHDDPQKSRPCSVHAANSDNPRRLHRKNCARLGRPPGHRGTPRTPKEKMTIRIDADLADRYRDWSWDQRCQLGELVELALKEFYSRRS